MGVSPILRRNDDSSLCVDHWQREQQLYAGSVDAETLAAELLGSFKDFKTTTAVNHALGKLFALLAKNLIPVRNAAVLAYIGQLLLHSLSGVKNETMRSRGPDAWLQIIRRALQNESRKPATSQLARTIPQAAIPPEEESSRTNSGGAASGKRGGTQCRCHAAPRTRSQPSSPRWRKRSSTGREQEKAGCGTPRCASFVLRVGVEESFRWAGRVLRARRNRLGRNPRPRSAARARGTPRRRAGLFHWPRPERRYGTPALPA